MRQLSRHWHLRYFHWRFGPVSPARRAHPNVMKVSNLRPNDAPWNYTPASKGRGPGSQLRAYCIVLTLEAVAPRDERAPRPARASRHTRDESLAQIQWRSLCHAYPATRPQVRAATRNEQTGEAMRRPRGETSVRRARAHVDSKASTAAQKRRNGRLFDIDTYLGRASSWPHGSSQHSSLGRSGRYNRARRFRLFLHVRVLGRA